MTAPRVFSHAALNVGRGDGPLAARLLTCFGFDVTDNGPSARGESWYTATFDAASYAGGLEHLGCFVIPASDEQLSLERVLSERCASERQMYIDAKLGKPDSSGHLAVKYRSLECLEDAVTSLRVDEAVASRCEVATLRPLAAEDDFEALLDRSPVFADAARVRYLSDGVQVFVQTDLLSAGLLCLRQSFELNYSH
jgi:hypothetical protein